VLRSVLANAIWEALKLPILWIGSACLTTVSVLTHGLALWQQGTMIALFAILFCFAVVSTVRLNSLSPTSDRNTADVQGKELKVSHEALIGEESDPPPKTPSDGPYVHVISEIQRLRRDAQVGDRQRYDQACAEISERIFTHLSEGALHRDKLAEEHFILVQLQSAFAERGEQSIADAIERGRRPYMVERGIIPVASTSR
jgi:hypothetical protein